MKRWRERTKRNGISMRKRIRNGRKRGSRSAKRCVQFWALVLCHWQLARVYPFGIVLRSSSWAANAWMSRNLHGNYVETTRKQSQRKVYGSDTEWWGKKNRTLMRRREDIGEGCSGGGERNTLAFLFLTESYTETTRKITRKLHRN